MWMIYVVIWGDIALVLLGERRDMALLHLVYELKSVRNLEFFINIVDVRFDSVHRNVQLLGHMWIGLSLDQ